MAPSAAIIIGRDRTKGISSLRFSSAVLKDEPRYLQVIDSAVSCTCRKSLIWDY